MRLAVRPLVALALLAALSGCAPSRTLVRRSDTAGLAAVAATLHGQRTEIRLASGYRHRGQVTAVRPDSTAWEEPDGGHTVPTADVHSFHYTSRSAGTQQGALMGVSLGGAMGLLLLAANAAGGDADATDASLGRAAAGLAIVSGLFIGAAAGAAGGSSVEIRLVE